MYKIFEMLAKREGIDIEHIHLAHCGSLYRSNIPEARKRLECIVKSNKPIFYMIPGGIVHT